MPLETAIVGTNVFLDQAAVAFLLSDLTFTTYFQNRVRLGRHKIALDFPYVVIDAPGGAMSLHSDRKVEIDEVLTVKVWALDDTNCKVLGRYTNNLLLSAQGTILIGNTTAGYGAALVPAGNPVGPILDPTKGPQGGNVFHMDFRYKCCVIETLNSIQQ